MTHPPKQDGPPDRGGPIERGSDLHRLLEMVAEAIARSRARGVPETTERSDAERPEGESDAGPPAPGA
jgi:hypothetical protein